MIELMLEAERAIGIGLLDRAERLYAQVVASDPKNSIAVTGLARVALERGDQRGAYTFARRALALDPENHMARHLSQRMAEQMRNRGEPLPDDPLDTAQPHAIEAIEPSSATRTAPEPPAVEPEAARPGLLDRLLRRRR